MTNSLARKALKNLIAMFVTITMVFSLQGGAGVNAKQSLGSDPETPVQSRVVGGAPIEISQTPWQVAVIGTWATNNFDGQFCGGSVISTEWIVTAAHCVTDDNGLLAVSPSDLRILAGTKTLNTIAPLTGIAVEEIVVHSDWDFDTNENDIAMLKLVTPLVLSDNVIETIGIPTVKPVAATSAKISGWGSTWQWDGDIEPTGTDPQWPTDLQGATVLVEDDAICSADDMYGIGFRPALMLCATTADFAIDTCQGDSGGPLATFDGSGNAFLSGITSYGVGCAVTGYAGVYTNVANYSGWVATNLLPRAITSTFSSPVRNSTGFTVNVTNYSADYTYLAEITSGSGSISKGTAVGSLLPITVSGLSAGASATIRVTTSRSDYNSASASLTSSATQPPAPAAPAAPAAAPVAEVPAVAPAPLAPTMVVKQKLSRKSLATQIGMVLTPKATIKITVAKSSKKVCAVSKNKLVALKPGICRVKVSVTPAKTKTNKKPKTVKKSTSIIVTKPASI